MGEAGKRPNPGFPCSGGRMGRKDEVRRRFWENNARFADLLNVIFADRKINIAPEDLQEENTVLKVSNKGRTLQKTGDMVWRISLHTTFSWGVPRFERAER